jgi:hypothetical protein
MTTTSNETELAVERMSAEELLKRLEDLAPPEEHEIHTSCGRVFKMTVKEMSDRQLASLIEQNQDSEALPEMMAEQSRRLLKRNREYANDVKRSLEHWEDDFKQRASDRPPGASDDLPLATPLTCSAAYGAAEAMGAAVKLIDLLMVRESA